MARNPYYIDGSIDGRGAGTEPLSSLHHSVGINNVGSYQVAGLPYLTGSSTLAVSGASATAMQARIQFPSVTRSFTVINTGATELRVHFASAVYHATNFPQGSETVMRNHHYIPLNATSASFSFDVKCDEVYITNMSTTATAKYTVYAELTQIPHARMRSPLSGSGINMFVGPDAKSADDRS